MTLLLFGAACFALGTFIGPLILGWLDRCGDWERERWH